MDNQQQYRDRIQPDFEEISLRELIEALLRGKKLIAIITIISILTSGIVSFFVLQPQYEAKTTLMASFATDRLTSNIQDTENVEGILDSLQTYPVMTIQTYKEQIKNPSVLEKTINELKLDKEKYKVNTLSKMIELQTVKDTNLISVNVKNSDPKLASEIANTVADNFTNHISQMSKHQASKSSEYIKNQLETEKDKLDKALIELKQFLAQPRGVDELNEEITLKLEELNEYKDKLSKEQVSYQTKLLNKELQQKEVQSTLDQAKLELEKTPEKLVTKSSLPENTILNDVVKENSDLSTSQTADIQMQNEEINPNYTTLSKQIANYEISLARIKQERENVKEAYNRTVAILKNKIDIVKKELEELQVELAEKDHQQKLIQRKVDLAQSTYDSFLNKYEEIRIAESTEIGDSSIIIVSKAIVPENPVAPNKKLNLAIAGVLGIMIGVFVVFFKEYWENTGEEKVSS